MIEFQTSRSTGEAPTLLTVRTSNFPWGVNPYSSNWEFYWRVTIEVLKRFIESASSRSNLAGVRPAHRSQAAASTAGVCRLLLFPNYLDRLRVTSLNGEVGIIGLDGHLDLVALNGAFEAIVLSVAPVDGEGDLLPSTLPLLMLLVSSKAVTVPVSTVPSCFRTYVAVKGLPSPSLSSMVQLPATLAAKVGRALMTTNRAADRTINLFMFMDGVRGGNCDIAASVSNGREGWVGS